MQLTGEQPLPPIGLIRTLGPNRFLADGNPPLRTVNQRFGLDLSEEHVNTLAGCLLHALGEIPAEGKSCVADGVSFTVSRMVGRRIDEVEVGLPEKV